MLSILPSARGLYHAAMSVGVLVILPLLAPMKRRRHGEMRNAAVHTVFPLAMALSTSPPRLPRGQYVGNHGVVLILG
jgi:hypothetical protein